jgi:hypothetical protein
MSERKALVIGINYYAAGSPLYGCVNDALLVKGVLERHADADESVNFEVWPLLGADAATAVSRRDLRTRVQELFAFDGECALFYFAGHGYVESTGGYILASDATSGDEGLALNDIMVFANKSKARNRVIILDSCNSGIAGARAPGVETSELSEGITILTASTKEQYASEVDGRGLFTALLVDALNGAAANLVGAISPGSLYAHIDQSLGSWEAQRPVFKTNVKAFMSLRNARRPISLADLRRITTLFPAPAYDFRLDPSYEPTSAAPDPVNTERFAVLQAYNRINLVTPVGAQHMYYAAMNSKSCQLTPLGEHYRRLVQRGRI